MRRGLETLAFWSLSIAGHLAVFVVIGGLSRQDPAAGQPPEQALAAAMPVALIMMPALSDDPPDAGTAAPSLSPPEAPQMAEAPDLPPAAPPEPSARPDRPDRPAIPAVFDSVPTVQATAPPPPPALPPKPAIDAVRAAPPEPAPKVPSPVAKAKPAATAKPSATAKPRADINTSKAAATPAAAAPQGGAASKALLATWGKGIMSALARQSVRGRDIPKGTVTLALNIDTAGRLVSARVARTSGHAVLDQAALSAVGRARFPAAPKGMPPGRHAFTLPVASR
jgi:protein TonB